MSQYPPTPPPQPPPGSGWDPNAGWAPAPAPAPEPAWTPPPQPAAPAGWQTQPQGYGTPPPGMPGGPPVQSQGRGPAIWIALGVVVVAALAAAGIILFNSDSAGADPEGVVRSYYDAAVDGDCDTMMDHIDLAASGTDRQTALGLCQEAYSDGGAVPTKLNSIEVTSENDSTATVTVSYETADGAESEDVNLNKVDGDWKINLGELGATPPDDTTTTTGESTTTTEESTTTTEESTTTTSGSTEEPSGSLTPPPDTAEMDDPALAELANACGGGDMGSCDQLFWDSELGGELETYAKTCGGLVPEGGASDQCVTRFGETVAAG